VTVAVVVYASRHCGWCARALALLHSKGIEPEVVVVDTVRERRREMELLSGRRNVPQIFIGDRHIGGYDDLRALEVSGELDELLGIGQATP
jgi:glutaredoxin 3